MKKLFALVLALLILVMPVCVLAGNDGNVNVPFDPAGGHGTLIETDNNEVNTAFIEPNYYPDYDRITPPEEAETAPKTNAGSLLPQFALAAVAVGSIAIALKRTK